jgi:asparagine synthase (glutamine-hydrolysing)
MCGIFLFIGKENIDGKRKAILETEFQKIRHRGPDSSRIRYYNENVMIGFHRLAITDPTDSGMQPFEDERYVSVTNGEIFNYLDFKFPLTSHSDCEVILPLFKKCGGDISQMLSQLDGEFATIIYDTVTSNVWFAVDELRVRPLFIGVDDNGIYLASEQKSLTSCKNVYPVPSGCYGTITNNFYEIYRYFSCEKIPILDINISMESACSRLRNLIIENLSLKIITNQDYGFLLSGGLDSSLLAGIGAKLVSPFRIRTFTVGFDKNASDVVAARKVAKYIDSIHTELIFTFEEGLEILRDVIRFNESWDQTTCRASVPMSLAIRKIKKLYPEIRIIFSGEIVDELLMGYLEWQNAPNLEAAKIHSIKRLTDITYFDGLRADRVVSSVGMELRLPYFSKKILNFVLSLPTELLAPSHNGGIEKYLLRRAFQNQGYIPEEILWRTKNAFSDATSIIGKNSWKEFLKSYAEKEITDSRFAAREKLYFDNPPQTKEDMLYREIFDSFNYKSTTIPYKWISEWSPPGTTDSSATALPNFKEV